MNRRAFLGACAGVLATAAGAGVAYGRRSEGDVLRVGVMSNLTHAPLLAGIGSERVAQAIAPTRLEVRVFRAGPRVTEALLGDAIDVGAAGPAPVVIHHARHAARGGGLRVIAGCASGGASLVVTRASGVARAKDLHGKRLAMSQIGTTQDVALRTFLRENGLADSNAGGDVTVMAVAPATILAQMKSGDLAGAWLAEPWATRVVRELDAKRLIDERDLWEGHRFASAILVSRKGRETEPAVARLAAALGGEVKRALAEPARARDEAYAELTRAVGNAGSRTIFDEAWGLIDFTSDPVRASIERFGAQAAALGLVDSPRAADGLF